MQATTRWHKGTLQIRFSDGVLATVIDALKHGFICVVDKKKIAHVWSWDVDDSSLKFSKNAAKSRTGIAVSTISSKQAIKDGKQYPQYSVQ